MNIAPKKKNLFLIASLIAISTYAAPPAGGPPPPTPPPPPGLPIDSGIVLLGVLAISYAVYIFRKWKLQTN